MKSVALGLIAALFMVLLALPAHADLDQRCLSLCINGGGTAATCLPKCSYNEKKSLPTDNSAEMTKNDVLTAPRPAPGLVLPPKKRPKTIGRDKDYSCFSQCLQNGGEYDRCSKTCSKDACTLTPGNCKGLFGSGDAPSSTQSPDLMLAPKQPR